MRYIYIFLILVMTALVLIFTFQNLQQTTVSFLSSSVTMPQSLLIILVYMLGMLTGGVVLAFLKLLLTKAKAKPASKEKQEKEEGSSDS